MACGRINNFSSAPCCDMQTHDHEYLGSTRFAELSTDPHNHRMAGMTGEAIPLGNNCHKHKLLTNTDFFDGHLHIVSDETGPCICVGYGKHVHTVAGRTSISDGHCHEYVFTTLIENPAGRCEQG